jgi:hypothetical protein
MPEWIMILLIGAGGSVAVYIGVSICNKYMPKEKAIALGTAHGNLIATAAHTAMKSTKYLNDKSIAQIEEGPYDTFWAYEVAVGLAASSKVDELRIKDGVKPAPPTVDLMGDTKIVER